MAQALESADATQAESGTYFGLIPPEFKEAVKRLAEDNFKSFQDKLQKGVILFHLVINVEGILNKQHIPREF